MAKQLFSQFRWAMFAESRLRCALAEVGTLGADQLAGLAFERTLARIVATPALNIPVLDLDAMSVVPTVRKVLASRFSLTFAEERCLTVAIPYTGDAVVFDTCPTTRPAGEPLRATVGEMAVSVVVPDDDWAPYAIDRVTCQLTGMLDALRADVAANEAAVGEAVEAAMLARQQALRSRPAEVVAFRAPRETVLPRISMQELSLAS